ncbi:MAG: hypothetical protein J5998_13770, partial [Clostridia bacterium]|nr:hypothetical protein [Clostridia bacterium]
MKRMICKAFAVALAVTLLLSVLPAQRGLAESGETAGRVDVTGIEAPVANMSPDCDATLTGEGCTLADPLMNMADTPWKNGVVWWDLTSERYVSPSGRIHGGHAYRVIVSVVADDAHPLCDESGAVFVECTINGKAAKPGYPRQPGNVVFYYDFPAVERNGLNIVDSVQILDVLKPYDGALPDRAVFAVGEGALLDTSDSTDGAENGVLWIDETEGRIMEPFELFRKGHQYSVRVFVKALDGWTFKDAEGAIATTGTMNGEPAPGALCGDSGAAMYFSRTFPQIPERKMRVESVAISNVKAPVAGEKPSYDALVMGAGAVLNEINRPPFGFENGVMWIDDTEGRYLTSYDTFQAGHHYLVYVYVKPLEGWTLLNDMGDFDTQGTINGVEAVAGADTNGYYFFRGFDQLPAGETKTVDRVDIVIPAPVAGSHPAPPAEREGEGWQTAVSSPANPYWLDGVSYSDRGAGLQLTAEDVFAEGRVYDVHILVYAKEGYTFFDADHNRVTAFTVNGAAPEAYTNSCEEGFVQLDVTFCTPSEGHLFPIDLSGFTEYDGGLFFVSGGDVVTEANGVVQDPNNPEIWYFCSQGQVQLGYSGLAEYGGKWFFLSNGILNTAYTGLVEYDGARFMVAAGRLLDEYDGLIQDPNTGLW